MSRNDATYIIDQKGLGIAGLIVAATLSLAACNTIKGVGEDTESVGETIQEVAD